MTNDYSEDAGVRLMLAYQAGDESAFDRLVAAYSGQVYSLLTRFRGNRHGREDMVQEVFLRVVRAREGYQPTARFSTWLYRITFNLCVNETQRSAGRDSLSLDADVDGTGAGIAAEVADPRSGPPSETVEREDVVRVVRAAIAALPEAQRMALVLAKYHDQPYAEIAAVLGSSEKAIKSLIHRARENLRETLAPYLQQELA